MASLVGASADAGGDILWTFATCTGRLSAQMEHEWLMSDPAAERTEARRSAMIGLLQATMSSDQAHQTLSWRIDAKQAQAVLLTRATFNDDAMDARWASRRAEAEIAACNSLLLG